MDIVKYVIRYNCWCSAPTSLASTLLVKYKNRTRRGYLLLWISLLLILTRTCWGILDDFIYGMRTQFIDTQIYWYLLHMFTSSCMYFGIGVGFMSISILVYCESHQSIHIITSLTLSSIIPSYTILLSQVSGRSIEICV